MLSGQSVQGNGKPAGQGKLTGQGSPPCRQTAAGRCCAPAELHCGLVGELVAAAQQVHTRSIGSNSLPMAGPTSPEKTALKKPLSALQPSSRGLCADYRSKGHGNTPTGSHVAEI